jgi:hypothetical protein
MTVFSGSKKQPLIQDISVTKEADELIACISAVNSSGGKDARKARMLSMNATLLLQKLALSNPAVLLLMKVKRPKA